MYVPMAYDIADNRVHSDGDGEREAHQSWRNKIEDDKELSADLASRLGMDATQLQDVIINTL
jgi:hypothetical protein